ncbi:MAG TPA: N-acetyltransferase [Anaerolineaceae bacterium]|nr:N-acetyltransferase [Anaerolineaceae bacterium]
MIIGDGIRLRGIEREDLPLFALWLNDPEVRRYLNHYAPISNAQEERWFEQTLQSPQAEQPLVIEVKQERDWIPVGNISFMALDQQSHHAELGLFIGDKNFWDKGIGTKAISLMLDYGFFTLNLHRIYLRVFEANKRGIRCYEKVGFQHEGRLREASFLDGKYYDMLWMGILRDEWRGMK